VRHYTPDGVLDEVVKVPARKVTACTFGGSHLDQLFIITSREGPETGADPLAGSLFRVVVGVRGCLFASSPGKAPDRWRIAEVTTFLLMFRNYASAVLGTSLGWGGM
jgi:hypothetical protein